MAWNPEVRTWISGELVTALLMNREIKDRWNVHHTIHTAIGDLKFPVGDAAESEIDDGEIAITQNFHWVEGSGDIQTITGGEEGQILILQIYSGQVIKSGEGNIFTIDGEDVQTDNLVNIAFLLWENEWQELWRSGASSGGGGGNSTPFVVFTPAHNNPPASAYATPDTRGSGLHSVLDFAGDADEEANFKGVLPPGYAGGDLEVTVLVSFTSATSGTSWWQAAFERVALSSLDIDSDSFDSFQSNGVGAPATSGHVVACTITLTSAQIDGLLAGEPFRLKIRRDSDATSGTDDITTDAELWAVTVAEVEA